MSSPNPDSHSILQKAMAMQNAPPRSKLTQYGEVIWQLRRKGLTLDSIAIFLMEEGISVCKSSVGNWLRAHPLPNKISLTKTTIKPTQTPKPFANEPDYHTDF